MSAIYLFSESLSPHQVQNLLLLLLMLSSMLFLFINFLMRQNSSFDPYIFISLKIVTPLIWAFRVLTSSFPIFLVLDVLFEDFQCIFLFLILKIHSRRLPSSCSLTVTAANLSAESTVLQIDANYKIASTNK
jgi:hypothetical protein